MFLWLQQQKQQPANETTFESQSNRELFPIHKLKSLDYTLTLVVSFKQSQQTMSKQQP